MLRLRVMSITALYVLRLREAMEFATKASAISVTRVGAQPSIPIREEVDNFKN